MGVAEVRRLRVLEEEKRHLKQLVADLSLDRQMLQGVLRKGPEDCPTALARLPVSVLPSQRTQELSLPRGSYQYRSVVDEQAALRMRIKDLAYARVSYGYRRFHVLL
jgi:hypothetical protein